MPVRDALEDISDEVVRCRACPRLVAWREEIGRVKRRAYRADEYWARAVPGFGDPRARLVLVGLAPGAHGANRTGRMFTGDSSGDFLYAALHRAGLASQPTSERRGDGLELRGCFITAAARCAPPENRPVPAELARCAPFLDRELEALRPLAVVALGAVAWDAVLASLARAAFAIPRPRPAFAHGAEIALCPPAPPVPDMEAERRSRGRPRGVALLGSYHVSRQNTQTGRLTAAMFDEILRRALALACT